MSARSRKSKTATATPVMTKRVSSVSSTQQSSQTRERSSSPLSVSREEEKDELAHLNSRLAGYIDYVRQLETERSKLTKRLEVITTEEFNKVDSIRQTYEKEIKSLRAMVDDLANRKSQMEIETKSAKDNAKDLRFTVNRLETQNANLEKSVERLEKELNGLRADPEKLRGLRQDLDMFKKRYETTKKHLDEETMHRTELENRVTGLMEELAFKDRLLKDDRQSIVEKRFEESELIESRRAADYESRLAEELAELRGQTAEELEQYKAELECAFEAKIQQMREANAGVSGTAAKTREELVALRRRLDDINQQLTRRTSEAEMYKKRLDDLEAQLLEERGDHEAQLRLKQDEIDRLNETLQFRLQEFSDLLHTKASLDQEIIMYRKMLETEESRLKISTPPRESVYGYRAGKKRRLDFDGDFLDDTALQEADSTGRGRGRAQYAYEVTSNASGNVEFDAEQNGTGKWVRLVNKSSEDSSIGGWTLIHMAEGNEVTHKFAKQTQLNAGAMCTIWSSETGTPHNPPTDILMKNQNFSAGSNISIRLLDEQGAEQASCTITKERLRPTKRLTTHRRLTDEKCSLM